jgi:hypothetical protein
MPLDLHKLRSRRTETRAHGSEPVKQDLIASAHDVLAEMRYGLETEEGA